MRLLPRKHVLQKDSLVHLLAAFSLFYPLAFLFSDSHASPWLVVVIWPLFLWLWYRGLWLEKQQIHWAFLASLLIAVMATYTHWSGAVLFFYGQMFLWKNTRIWQVILALLLQASLIVLMGWQWEYSLSFTLIFVLLILFGGMADYLFFRHIIAQRDLLMQQDELEYLSRVRERERIARDLHDVLGHTLSTIALKAELAGKLLQSDSAESARRELDDIAETARTALADVRQTVTGYRAGNLRSELTMAEHALSGAGLVVELPAKIPRLISRELENLLSLVMREAVTNVIRHAKAHSCRIQLFHQDERWHLIVQDDGIGWSGHYGNGLSGMKERLALYGGHLQVQRLAVGTRLSAIADQVLEGALDEID